MIDPPRIGALKQAATASLDLTPYGRAFAAYDAQRQHTALRRLVLWREPMRSVLTTLHERGGLTRPMFAHVLQELAPLAWNTALRRAQTMSLWFVTLELARRRSGTLVYSGPVLTADTRSPADRFSA